MRLTCREAFADRIGTLTAIVDDSREATGDRLRALDLLGRYSGLLQAAPGDEDARPQLPDRGQVLEVSAEILNDERKLAAVMRALPCPPRSVVVLPIANEGLESRPASEMLLAGSSGSTTTASVRAGQAPEARQRPKAPDHRKRRIAVVEDDLPATRNPQPAGPRRQIFERHELDDFDGGDR